MFLLAFFQNCFKKRSLTFFNNPYIIKTTQRIKIKKEDLITRSTYHSNAIEGSTLTYAETYAILYNDNSFKIEGKEPREI